MAAPILTDGTSRAGAVTLGLAPIRDGTMAGPPETSALVTRASMTRAPAVIHVMPAVHVLVVIRALAPVRAGIPVPTRGGTRASGRARMLVPTRVAVPVHTRAAFRTPAWILASVRSGPGVPTRAGVAVRARAGDRAPAWARTPGSARVGFLMLAGTRVPVLTRAGFRAVGRAGALGAIHAVALPRAAGLVPGQARNPVPDGRGHRAMVRRPACRCPPRLARWHPKTPWARGGLGVPIKVLARGPATGAGRIQAPGRAAAGPGQETILGPVVAR
jgi:hypothetical protein